jgi:hypothetical protein
MIAVTIDLGEGGLMGKCSLKCAKSVASSILCKEKSMPESRRSLLNFRLIIMEPIA